MARRRRKSTGSTLPALASLDYGHAFARRNARIVPTKLGAAAGMELSEVADIDHPDRRGATVRVARRSDPLLGILDITDRTSSDGGYFLAAESFREVCRKADGSAAYCRPDIFGRVLSVGCPADAELPTITRLAAQTKAREAWRAVRGEENNADVADVIRLVLLAYCSLAAVDRHRRWRHGKSKPLLERGLARLAEFYRTG